MTTRNEQDNNISLYSYRELVIMAERLRIKTKSFIPFTFEEIKSEINKRDKEVDNIMQEVNSRFPITMKNLK